MSEENSSKGLKRTLDNLKGKSYNNFIITVCRYITNFEQIEKFSISGLLSILSNRQLKES